ncbi:MAG: EI24 domain-containing protein [Gemmatimonas sp.]
MLSHLYTAFAQAHDPAFRRVIVRGAVAAIALFVALVGAAAWALQYLALTGIGWLDSAIAAIGGIAAVIVAGLLFPGAMVAVQGIFLDDAAEAVERRHYPDDLGRAPPVAAAAWGSVRLALVTVLLNLLALPIYLFFPAVNVALFYSLNGYLLGREYFELVALRHMPLGAARDLRRRHRAATFVAGVVIAFLFSIPMVGLFLPAFAAAFMVHVYEGIARERTGAPTRV